MKKIILMAFIAAGGVTPAGQWGRIKKGLYGALGASFLGGCGRK